MTEWKVAPSNKEAEEAVLGCILVDGVSIFEKAVAWIQTRWIRCVFSFNKSHQAGGSLFDSMPSSGECIIHRSKAWPILTFLTIASWAVGSAA